MVCHPPEQTANIIQEPTPAAASIKAAAATAQRPLRPAIAPANALPGRLAVRSHHTALDRESACGTQIEIRTCRQLNRDIGSNLNPESNMMLINWIKNLSVVLLMDLAGAAASGQVPVISSFGQNGLLVCTNLWPGSTSSVEWAASVLGPWTNSWAGLGSVTVDSNGAIRVSVPMFYRVRGTGWTNPAVPPFVAPTNMS